MFTDLPLKMVVDMYTRKLAQSYSYICMRIWSQRTRETIPYIISADFYSKSNNSLSIRRFLTGSSRRARRKTKTCFRHLLARLSSANHCRDCQQLVNNAVSHSRTHARAPVCWLGRSLCLSRLRSLSMMSLSGACGLIYVKQSTDGVTSVSCLLRLSMFGDAASKAYCTQIYLCCQRWINT